jgi:addiction module RelE/StbE family toxin
VNRVLLTTGAFLRAARKTVKKSRDADAAIETALELLAIDAWHPRLKTHKLTGDMKDLFSCSAGYDLRIVFQFVEHEGREAILLLTVGTHEEIY